jgi:HlyD family secretion protein
MTKKTMIGLGVVVLAVAAVLLFRGRGNGETGTYRFVTIGRTDVESTVSATGSLSAVSTVQVGTQVSGQVAEIHADFNSQVRKGQLLARIDPTLQEQAVKDAQASLDRAHADLGQKQFQYDQAKDLFDKHVLTETEYRTAEYNLALSKSSLTSAETGLERAQRNLAYTKIWAPIEGTVIERNVDVGQTVAASLSAPQLFLIAEDLSRMQILVSVDESDIGEIHEGQEVRFTVQAYPDEHFSGVVKQVRLQSTSQENVVNYTVVVAVSNPDRKLLPGMTATVEFILAQAKDVLAVPNAALRFRATDRMRTEVGPTPRERDGVELWYLDDAGALRVTRARAGLTDGAVTEITAPDLKDGMEVIAAVTAGGSVAPSTTNANPFEPQQGGRGGPPRGF